MVGELVTVAGEGRWESVLNRCGICAHVQFNQLFFLKVSEPRRHLGTCIFSDKMTRQIHSKILIMMSGRIMDGDIFDLWFMPSKYVQHKYMSTLIIL